MLFAIIKSIRLILLAGAVSYALVMLFKRLNLYNQGQQYEPAEVIQEKGLSFLQKMQIFHYRMMRDPVAHLYHTLIVLGFILSIAGHIIRPLCLSGAGLMGLGSGMALIKRLLLRNPSREIESGKIITLVVLFLMAISGVLSYLNVLIPNISHTAIMLFATLHSLSISLFLIVFANTRLIHMMTASMQLNAKTAFNTPGVFNGADETVQAVTKVISGAVEDNTVSEDVSHYGFQSINDLDNKNRLAVDACMECSRCDIICPAANTGKLLSPQKFTTRIRQIMERGSASKTIDFAADPILREMTWQCSICYSCESSCPVLIDRVNTVVNIRRNLILDQGEAPEGYQKALKNLRKSENIWGYSKTERLNAEFRLIDNHQPVDYTIWLGCFYTYDSNMRKILKNLLQLLEKANVKYNFSDQEICCGDPARRIGDEYLFQEMVQKNIQHLAEQGVRSLLTLCPHCTNSLRNEYSAFGFNIPVKHYLEIIPDLLKKTDLQKVNDLNEPVFYHHSCYLSRCAQMSDIPYTVLKEQCGFTAIIPERYVEGTTLCCGGGGGRILVEEKLPERPANLIIEKAKKFGARRIVTSCPYCYLMLSDSCKGIEPEMKVFELLELLNL